MLPSTFAACEKIWPWRQFTPEEFVKALAVKSEQTSKDFAKI
jgi:hypothetical protein